MGINNTTPFEYIADQVKAFVVNRLAQAPTTSAQLVVSFALLVDGLSISEQSIIHVLDCLYKEKVVDFEYKNGNQIYSLLRFDEDYIFELNNQIVEEIIIEHDVPYYDKHPKSADDELYFEYDNDKICVHINKVLFAKTPIPAIIQQNQTISSPAQNSDDIKDFEASNQAQQQDEQSYNTINQVDSINANTELEQSELTTSMQQDIQENQQQSSVEVDSQSNDFEPLQSNIEDNQIPTTNNSVFTSTPQDQSNVGQDQCAYIENVNINNGFESDISADEVSLFDNSNLLDNNTTNTQELQNNYSFTKQQSEVSLNNEQQNESSDVNQQVDSIKPQFNSNIDEQCEQQTANNIIQEQVDHSEKMAILSANSPAKNVDDSNTQNINKQEQDDKQKTTSFDSSDIVFTEPVIESKSSNPYVFDGFNVKFEDRESSSNYNNNSMDSDDIISQLFSKALNNIKSTTTQEKPQQSVVEQVDEQVVEQEIELQNQPQEQQNTLHQPTEQNNENQPLYGGFSANDIVFSPIIDNNAPTISVEEEQERRERALARLSEFSTPNKAQTLDGKIEEPVEQVDESDQKIEFTVPKLDVKPIQTKEPQLSPEGLKEISKNQRMIKVREYIEEQEAINNYDWEKKLTRAFTDTNNEFEEEIEVDTSNNVIVSTYAELKDIMEKKDYKFKPYSNYDSVAFYSKNYIFSNRLSKDTAIYTYIFMLLELILAYFFVDPIINKGIAKYIILAVVLLIIPGAFIARYFMFKDKRKPAKFQFRISLVTALMIYVNLMVMAVLLAFFVPSLNVNVNDIKTMIPTIFYPAGLFLTIPISVCIYSILYNSKKYHLH